MRHVSPEDSECAARDTSPGILRVRHLSPSTPAGRLTPDAPEPAACPAWPSPESPSWELSEWAEPRGPLPGALRVRQPESPAPRDYPGHSASTPRFPGSVSLPAEI